MTDFDKGFIAGIVAGNEELTRHSDLARKIAEFCACPMSDAWHALEIWEERLKSPVVAGMCDMLLADEYARGE